MLVMRKLSLFFLHWRDRESAHRKREASLSVVYSMPENMPLCKVQEKIGDRFQGTVWAFIARKPTKNGGRGSRTTERRTSLFKVLNHRAQANEHSNLLWQLWGKRVLLLRPRNEKGKEKLYLVLQTMPPWRIPSKPSCTRIPTKWKQSRSLSWTGWKE